MEAGQSSYINNSPKIQLRRDQKEGSNLQYTWGSFVWESSQCQSKSSFQLTARQNLNPLVLEAPALCCSQGWCCARSHCRREEKQRTSSSCHRRRSSQPWTYISGCPAGSCGTSSGTKMWCESPGYIVSHSRLPQTNLRFQRNFSDHAENNIWLWFTPYFLKVFPTALANSPF